MVARRSGKGIGVFPTASAGQVIRKKADNIRNASCAARCGSIQ
ncbi:No hit [Brucella canis HSK A52141]|nr:No hit [Brucella canis HSK A52141]